MSNEEQDQWDDDEEDDPEEQELEEVRELLTSIDHITKKAMHYLELEGFVEKTDDPNVYKYTPEGLVMARRQYKQMRDQGLL